MFLADYHMHTNFSPDAHDPMLDMALAAADRGINELCFTDHVETCAQSPYVTDQFPPFTQWDELRETFEDVKSKTAGRLDVHLGVELNDPHFVPDVAKEIYADPSLDFIIGSIHNIRDTDDFCYLEYTSLEYCRSLLEQYFKEYIELARTECFDVLGHLGYVQRYLARQGITYDTMEFEPLIRELFNITVGMGKGIELNTSTMHDALGRLIPDVSVIELYRQCGGEIVTVGSDAHYVCHAGYGIADAYELLRTLGFKYVSTYRAHEPRFIKL